VPARPRLSPTTRPIERTSLRVEAVGEDLDVVFRANGAVSVHVTALPMNKWAIGRWIRRPPPMHGRSGSETVLVCVFAAVSVTFLLAMVSAKGP
jgi:hypothetical protein